MPRNTSGLKRTAGPGRPHGSRPRLTVARVEDEIRDLALLDPIELFAVRNKRDGTITCKLKAIYEMPPRVRACIASMKVKTVNLKAGDGEQDEIVEIKFWDKVKALELCARHFKWVDDKLTVEVGVSEAILARLDAWKVKNRERLTGESESQGLPTIDVKPSDGS